MRGPGELPDGDWFRRMADNGALVFFALRVQPDIAFEFINDAIEAQIGVPAAEALSDAETVLSRIDPRHAQRLAEALAVAPGNETVIEMVWQHRAGGETASKIRFCSRQREDGSVILEGTAHDVTQLHEATAELRQSERRHRLLAENAWEVVWTMAMDTTITYVSPAVEQVRGFTPEEAMKESLAEALTPESAVVALGYFQQLFEAMEKGEALPIFHSELDFYRKDKSVMSADLQVIPHVDENGEIIELLGVSRDISERKKADADLRRSEARYRLLAENAWDVVWTMDMDARITYVSPSIQRVLGIPAEQAMFATLRETLTPQSEASVLDYFRRLWAAIESGTEPPALRDEHEYRRHDGSTMIGELQIVPSVDADGRVVEILGVTRDISERKAFEAELTPTGGDRCAYRGLEPATRRGAVRGRIGRRPRDGPAADLAHARHGPLQVDE